MSRLIQITYFVNPYCFYFKYTDDLHNEEFAEFEEKISKHARHQLGVTTDYTPKRGNIVAAFQCDWGKWVRAKVRSNITNVQSYELWAVDYGKVFWTSHKNIVQLPQHLIDRVPIVHQGSLYGICPSKREVNEITGEFKDNPIEEWSRMAINQFNKFIEDKCLLQISFEIVCQYENYYFGNITCKILHVEPTTKLSIFDMKKPLIKMHEATEQADFKRDMNRIRAKYNLVCDGNAINDRSDALTDTSSVVSTRQRLIDIHIKNCAAGSEINGGATRMRANHGNGAVIQQQAPVKPQDNLEPRMVTNAAEFNSEINGGETRMRNVHSRNGMTNQPRAPVQSHGNYGPRMVPVDFNSEINGGATRMRVNHGNGAANQWQAPVEPPDNFKPRMVPNAAEFNSEINGGETRMRNIHSRNGSVNLPPASTAVAQRNIEPVMIPQRTDGSEVGNGRTRMPYTEW